MTLHAKKEMRDNAAENKAWRVSIKLHTHISELEGLKNTVVNRALPFVHGGSFEFKCIYIIFKVRAV